MPLFLNNLKNILGTIGCVLLALGSQTACNSQSSENKAGSSQPESSDKPLRIAAASNLAPVLPDIIKSYKAESYQSDKTLAGDSLIDVTYASSGKLYAQIKAGAPYDIFLSADQDLPANLEATSKGLATKPFTYTQGQLALYSETYPLLSPESIEQDASIQPSFELPQLLKANPNSKVAIANSTLAPYGLSAEAYLKTQQLLQPLKKDKRLIQAENISQAFQYVYTKNVDFGFVATSQLVANHTDSVKYYTLKVEEYPAILQDGIVISAHPHAIDFADYLQSDSAQKQFVQAGYLSIK